MRALVVDDEPLARALLRRWLAAHTDVVVVGEAADGDAAAAQVAALDPEVVFLDIELPGRDGFGVITALPAPPAVVFVTAHDHYAVRAFDVDAVDYLRKPFDEERLAAALARVRAHLAGRAAGGATALRSAAEALSAVARARRQRLAIRDGDATLLVPLDEIEWIEAAGKHVAVHVLSPRPAVIRARDTLTGLEQRLDPDRFVRIHRSTIVNVDHIRAIRPWFAGDQHLTLTSGHSVTTGRGFRDRLRDRVRP
jgi:two-component system LytT family response regulator